MVETRGPLRSFVSVGLRLCRISSTMIVPPIRVERRHTSGLTPQAHYAKLIDRKGRYGRFRHASSLPKTHALP
jgi:hypothetical protein